MMMAKRQMVRLVALVGVALPVIGIPVAACAQQAPQPSGEQREFDVPAQALGSAALRFSDQARVQLVVDPTITQGLRANAVRGRFSVADALNRLLSGTGLTWRYVNPRVITIERAGTAAADAIDAPITGDRVFGAVNIQGQQATAENGFADIGGFGAGAGSNGSSDVAATEGTGSLTTNGTVVASRLPQALQQTTQSVSVLTQERLKQQNITDLNTALQFTPGITVQTINGTDSRFLSRGFPVTTFSIDGGAPLSVLFDAQGSLELSQYDRVEVLRGSSGQYGANGDPSGTISLIRKRPLDHFQLNLEAGVGSHGDVRGEYDVTGPIGFDDHLRARFVLSGRDRDFFYDVAHQTRGSGYGVFEVDLGSRSLVRVGGSFQEQKDGGVNSIGVPRFANGDELPLPRSTNFQAPFAQQDVDTTELFAAFEHRFSEGWNIKIDATRRRVDGETLGLTLSFGPAIFPGTANPTLLGLASRGMSTNKQLALTGTLTGKVQLFGLDQNIVVGGQYSDQERTGFSALFLPPIYTANLFGFDPNLLTELPGSLQPGAPGIFNSADTRGRTKLAGAYASIDLNPIRQLHLTGGFRYSDLSGSGVSVGAGVFGPSRVVRNSAETALTFNASASFDFKKWLTAYLSFNDIFQEQTIYLTPEGVQLKPARGQTFEGGLRFRLHDEKLNGSISYYDTRQKDLSSRVGGFGQRPPPGVVVPPGSFCCYAQAARFLSKGVDVELTGQLTQGWQIQASYNYNNNKIADFDIINLPDAVTTEQPRHEARLFTVYDLPGPLKRLTLGAGMRLESKRSVSGNACLELNAAETACLPGRNLFFSFGQPTYAVGDAFLRYRLRENIVIAFNVTNFTDAKYFAQTGSTSGSNFYGEPRQFALSIRTSLGDRR